MVINKEMKCAPACDHWATAEDKLSRYTSHSEKKGSTEQFDQRLSAFWCKNENRMSFPHKLKIYLTLTEGCDVLCVC